MKEIKDFLEEKHVGGVEKILDFLHKDFTEHGNIHKPYFLLLTKESDKAHNMPVPGELLNSNYGRNAVASLIKKFKKYLIEEESQTPYAFIMITQATARKIPRDSITDEEFLNLDSKVIMERATSIEDVIITVINTIDKGDLNIMVDKIENEDGAFIVNPEKTIIYTPHDAPERQKSLFNIFSDEE